MFTNSPSANSSSDARSSQAPLSSAPISSASLLIATAFLMAVGSLLIASPAAGQDVLGEPASSEPASGGPEPAISGQASLQVIGGAPQGGLRDHIGAGAGLQGFIGGWTGPESPLMLGLDVAFLGYGHTTDEVPFSSTVGPRVPVEVSTSNNVLEMHLSARLQPRTGRFRPYIEGLVGFKYLFTRTTLGDGVVGNDFSGEEFGDDFGGEEFGDDFGGVRR
jgi:hypothetical protein